MAITSCSKIDLELEATSAGVDDTFTRADLVEYTINVEKAGTLDSLVEAGNYSNAQKLIVTGNIGYDDVNYVDVNMPTVEVLDLSGATYESKYISDTFLSDSNKIKEISLPGNIISISGVWDHSPFYRCSSLTSIHIPEGVTSIGSYAFYNCSSLTSITIPESVTSIGYYAFWGCRSLTITIPEGVTSIGNYALGGKKIIFNSLINDIGDLSSSSNLYCWLIINRPDGNIPMYGPNWKNVVINGVAESVTLPYQRTVDFTIPEEVKSIKKISYTMTFSANYSSSSYGRWRTIALPFKPTSITHAEKGLLAPFDSGVEGAKNFWLRELTTNGFKDVTQIEPNHPYLIAMPYSKIYDDKYNISGEVTFSAENLTTEDFANNMPLSAVGTDYTMYASYSYMDKAEGVYALEDNYGNFVSNYSSVYPYEAYLKANTATMRSVISLNQGRAATRASGNDSRKPQKNDM
jgi:hypothetical protein